MAPPDKMAWEDFERANPVEEPPVLVLSYVPPPPPVKILSSEEAGPIPNPAFGRKPGGGKWGFLREMMLGEAVDLPDGFSPNTGATHSAIAHATKITGFRYSKRGNRIWRVK